jgi:hypothetical protein
LQAPNGDRRDRPLGVRGWSMQRVRGRIGLLAFPEWQPLKGKLEPLASAMSKYVHVDVRAPNVATD